MKILEIETSWDYIAFKIKLQKSDTTGSILQTLLDDSRCKGNVYYSTVVKESTTKLWITFYTKPGYSLRTSGLQAPGAHKILESKKEVRFEEKK